MFLDDGVSRESAPSSVFLAERNHKALDDNAKQFITKSFGDDQAKNAFTQYRIEQVSHGYSEPQRLRF